MKKLRFFPALAALMGLGGRVLLAQAPPGTQTPEPSQPTNIDITISKGSAQRIPIALPSTIAPITPELQGKVVDPFQLALSDDLSGSVFLITDVSLYPKGMRPPATKEQADAWIVSGAHYLLDTQIHPSGDQITVEAELFDLKTLKSRLGKRYTGEARAARRIAHTLANDLVREFTGRPGPFLTKIAFVSDRDAPGAKEVYVMDFDGENQRRVTYHKSFSLAPDWSPDGTKIVYQTFSKVTSSWGLSVIAKETGDIKPIPLTTSGNFSPSYSPDGKTIAYCGSVKGNPEIFTVGLDGSGLKRLTDTSAIDSTPRWAPNGRELAFTSNRQGSAQIYLMDLEGANVRRLSRAGNLNDEAAFSPDGGRVAYACRNEGELQICVHDLLRDEVVQVSKGPGAHENPTWSADGSKLAWELSIRGSTQIVIANPDGTGMKPLTSVGNNTSPVWSKSLP